MSAANTKNKITTVLLDPHAEFCYAIKNYKSGRWSTPWSYLSKDSITGSKVTPRARGMVRWNIIRCNCTECWARIAVREDDVLNMLPSGAP